MDMLLNIYRWHQDRP